jgi:hypothetical protein
MNWNDHGAAAGYEYQQPQTTGITIRAGVSEHAPKTLSRNDADRIKEAVREIEKREKK